MIQTHKSDEVSINRLILDSSPAAIATVDHNGKFIYSNAGFLTLTGYEENKIKQLKVECIIPEWNHFSGKNHQGNHSAVELNTYIKHQSGKKIQLKMGLSRINWQGQALITIHVFQAQSDDEALVQQQFNQNTSDPNHCYIELKRTTNVLEFVNQQLEDSLASRRTFFDNAGVMLFSANRDGLIEIFNLEAERVLGYTKEEIINKEKIDFFFCDGCLEEIKKQHPSISNTTDSIALLRYLANNNRLKEKEVHLKRKNDTEFPALLTITPIYNKQEKFIGYMGVASDITERKNIEKKLLDALDKEKQLGEMKSRFVTIASHEFRTPLSTILSSAYLTGRYHKTEDQHKRDRHLNRIISAVNTLSDMLNDFLNLGKIEEGKITMKVTEFDIKETISLVIHDIKTNAKKGQTFFYQHFGVEKVNSDPSLIRNILLNLISNAIKFSQENGIINVKSFVENHQISFHVEDNGIGIPEQDKKQISEKFFRASNASNIQGTGLGLHIVSKYVERLKGTIDCHSELNKGTSFQITVPLKK